MSRLEIQVPLRRAMSRLFCEVFSLVRTKKLPIIEAKMPMAAARGQRHAGCAQSGADGQRAARDDRADIGFKQVGAHAATSPTLSPTLSAITAGLRGSSSGMPTSTLPTRSAPTSAALVKIPPPTLANRAKAEAPIPNVIITEEMVVFRSIPLTGFASNQYLRK